MLDLYYQLKKMPKEERKVLKQELKKDKPNYLYREYLSDETVREYLYRHYDPTRNGKNDFYYTGVPKEERFTLFIDVKMLVEPEGKGVKRYQARESDALYNMDQAFEYMYTIHEEPITVQHIKQLHQRAAKHLRRIEYQGWGGSHESEIHGRFKKSCSGDITFVTQNVSTLGLFKMFDRFKKVHFDEDYRIGEIKTDRMMADMSYPQEGYKERINQLIVQYESKVKQENALEKLKAIVGFVQSLDFLHPFYDGNTRVFETLLLNRELIRHNFTPALLYDPNLFTCSSKKEALFDVIRGMETFMQFQNTKEIIPAMKMSY